MVGSGNVGLVVSFQLLQAGCQVVAVIDAAPRVGGYGVHAAKVARTGVPFYMSHTVVEAKGGDYVTSAVIAQVDDHFQPIPGTEKHFDCDTLLLSVGLIPENELTKEAGIEIVEARITYLAYAPEIAAVMLQRQQASAIIDARKMIVDGAVGMVEMALERLAQNNTVELDEERKAAMVSNLLVVLCGNRDAQPIVNSGSLY